MAFTFYTAVAIFAVLVNEECKNESWGMQPFYSRRFKNWEYSNNSSIK
jgi:hypothetical protein